MKKLLTIAVGVVCLLFAFAVQAERQERIDQTQPSFLTRSEQPLTVWCHRSQTVRSKTVYRKQRDGRYDMEELEALLAECEAKKKLLDQLVNPSVEIDAVAQLHKQLGEAKATELAAMAEFRRYGTPYYEKEWSRAIEKSREMAEKLSRAEKQRAATAR